MPSPSPTAKTYTALEAAYRFFNAELFGGRLPPCLITMQRRTHSYGYTRVASFIAQPEYKNRHRKWRFFAA